MITGLRQWRLLGVTECPCKPHILRGLWGSIGSFQGFFLGYSCVEQRIGQETKHKTKQNTQIHTQKINVGRLCIYTKVKVGKEVHFAEWEQSTEKVHSGHEINGGHLLYPSFFWMMSDVGHPIKNRFGFLPEEMKIASSDWPQAQGLDTVLCTYFGSLWFKVMSTCPANWPHPSLLPQYFGVLSLQRDEILQIRSLSILSSQLLKRHSPKWPLQSKEEIWPKI